jgi:hypothetical protein
MAEIITLPNLLHPSWKVEFWPIFKGNYTFAGRSARDASLPFDLPAAILRAETGPDLQPVQSALNHRVT